MHKQQKTRKEKKERKRRRRRRRNGDAAQADLGHARPAGRRVTQAAKRPRPPRDPGHRATQVGTRTGRAARPRSRSFFTDEHIFSIVVVFFSGCPCGFFFFFVFFLNVNRVLETQFPCRCHMEKVPQTTTHENRVPKTRFIDPKSSLLDSKC